MPLYYKLVKLDALPTPSMHLDKISDICANRKRVSTLSLPLSELPSQDEKKALSLSQRSEHVVSNCLVDLMATFGFNR